MRRAIIASVFALCSLCDVKAGNNNTHYSYFAAETIKGTVLDDYGHPLEGATVRVKNAAASVVTNEDGAFEIEAIAGATLVVTVEGFYDSEVKVKGKGPLVIKLMKSYLQQPDTVNVLYSEKDAQTRLGSMSSIYTNQLTTTPAPLYAYSLAGRLPGLYTQQTRGFVNAGSTAITQSGMFGEFPTSSGLATPNDNTEIFLRLRGQSPVTIVDGVQRDIFTLDPENIESVSVLKDALSTLLLGVNSSRGVILVTTKKPLKGTPHVSFTAQTGMQTPLGLPDVLPAYQYAYLYNEALLNAGSTPAYTYEDFAAFRDHTDPYGHPDVNWFNTILEDRASITRYTLGVSGGGGAARYAVGLGYFNQQGLFKDINPDYNANADIKRYTINTNVDVDITKQFNAQLQIFAKIQDGNQPGAGTNNIISALYTTPNNAYPLLNPDGSFGGSQNYPTNLYAMVNNTGYVTDYNRDVVSNLVLTYKLDRFVKGMWAKAQTNISVYGSNIINRVSSSPTFKFTIDPNSGDTSYSRFGSTNPQSNSFSFTSNAQFWYLQTALGYDRQFGASTISGKFFYDRNESIFAYDLPKTNQNIAASATYDFKKRYFVEGVLTYGGSDRYPPGKRFGFFYAGGLGWDIAQENFIKSNAGMKWMNRVKLSATYGMTGNDNVGYFTWRPAYSTSSLDNGTYLAYAFGSSRTPENGLSQDRLANPNVTWEKSNKFNAGIDVSLFGNHVQATAEYYNNRYFDLMQQRGKQSAIIGIAYPNENIGINRYTGAEFTLTYQDHYKDFNYFITGNLSIEQSEVVFMDEIEQKYTWNERTGLPVGIAFGYIADGFIQTQEEAETSATVAGYTLQPGDIKLKDLNADGTINQYDLSPIGSTKPLVYYGLTLGFNYKGFDVSMLLQGVSNRKIILTDPSFGSNGRNQTFTYIIGRWTPETAETATYPRLTQGYNPNNDINPIFGGGSVNTFWVHSGDYFRIKNAEVGYTVPLKLTSRFKIPSIRVFANGINLFTYSKYGRVDPEVSGQVYPIQRVINFGLNVKF